MQHYLLSFLSLTQYEGHLYKNSIHKFLVDWIVFKLCFVAIKGVKVLSLLQPKTEEYGYQGKVRIIFKVWEGSYMRGKALEKKGYCTSFFDSVLVTCLLSVQWNKVSLRITILSNKHMIVKLCKRNQNLNQLGNFSYSFRWMLFKCH